MTYSSLSLFRFGPRELSLLLTLGTSLVAIAQSYAAPAIQCVRTDGTKANPANSTSLVATTKAGQISNSPLHVNRKGVNQR